MRQAWWRWLLVPFALLPAALSLAVALFYRPQAWRWRAGALELVAGRKNGATRIWGRPGGQSWGARVIWYASGSWWENAGLRVHERVHAAHGEIVNALAHVALVPPAAIWGGAGWIVAAVLLAQAAFGISYGAHFLAEWRRLGYKRSAWRAAYLRIWSERIAYRVEREFNAGQRPEAWGK